MTIRGISPLLKFDVLMRMECETSLCFGVKFLNLVYLKVELKVGNMEVGGLHFSLVVWLDVF